jgi:HSP20 family molecular chaperone IbpA
VLTRRDGLDVILRRFGAALHGYNVGNYVRQFTLTEEIEESSIKARMRNGVLEVGLPKRELAKPRRIEVAAE